MAEEPELRRAPYLNKLLFVLLAMLLAKKALKNH